MCTSTEGADIVPRGLPELPEWLHLLLDESPMAIGFSRDGLMLDANPAYVRLFGHASVEALRGRSILDQIAPSHRAQVQAAVAQRARGDGAPHRYETRGLRRDGTEFPFEVVVTRIGVDGKPLTVAFFTDLSERVAAHEALRASEERFRTLSSAALEGVFLHAEGKIVLANEPGAAMFGYDATSILGKSILDLAAPESRDKVIDHVGRDSAAVYEGPAQRRDGSRFVAEVRGTSLSHQGRPMRVTIIRDVTERRRLEAEQSALAERIRQAQKLESLGVLAGGVAHDFNNILMVVANCVALARRDVAQGREVTPQLDTIGRAVERAADLCRQMLAYAGKASIAREALDLSALVAEMASMLEVSVAKRATLVRELAPGLPGILGDATQIRQIVMNLVINAAEAIVRSDGTVRLSTGVATYGPGAFAHAAAGGDLPPGTYVHVEVGDDGMGMDAATAAQMFDPFFTTKFVGRGLGMAAVLGIVRGHAGAIEVESRPNAGTRIRVLFPAAESPAKRLAPPPEAAPRGEGVVLVIDDERNVRVSTQLLLRELGFEALVADGGAEGIAIVKADPTRVSAVLLDLTMPRMDGRATLRELRKIAPSLPVVLTSGHGEGPLADETGVAADAVLAKPYTVDGLVGTLRRVMRRP